MSNELFPPKSPTTIFIDDLKDVLNTIQDDMTSLSTRGNKSFLKCVELLQKIAGITTKVGKTSKNNKERVRKIIIETIFSTKALGPPILFVVYLGGVHHKVA